MATFLERSNRFLSIPLGLVPRLMLVVSAALLSVTLVLPLWNMTMFAPQYPDGLRLDIYTQRLEGGNKGQDLREINLLNHYIGMRDLADEDFTEFKWMPFAIGILALLCLRSAVHGTMASLVDTVVIFTYFGLFSLWSFGYKLYMYGHQLAPTAPVTVDPFMPPMFGYQKLANFEVYSYPAVGSYTMAATALLLFAALALAWRSGRRSAAVSAAGV
jgi:copper chaperone NosL